MMAGPRVHTCNYATTREGEREREREREREEVSVRLALVGNSREARTSRS